MNSITDLSRSEKIGIDSDIIWKSINLADDTATPILDNATKDAYVQK